VRIKAFTLLELITAVAILSVGIVVVLQAISYSVRVAGLSCDFVRAAFLAEDKLQELEYKEGERRISGEAKEAQGDEDKFAWKQAIVLDDTLNLYKLDFAVSWKSQNRQEGFKVGTYLKE
jgi:prepilin-type N-terminal cleavage/methylation domain-containing protein